jgi:beta-glucosidase
VLPVTTGSNTGSVHSIAVIGQDAGSGAVTAGGGSAAVTSSGTVTPMQGIQSRAGSGVAVRYDDGADTASAAALAQGSDLAVVFVDAPEAEKSDLADIDLPGNQNALISAVAAANPHTVVVVNSGSAVTMPWLDQVSGVLEAWYPGQTDGAAIAALLFGDVDPSGKLPVTFPRSLADVPANTPAQWPGVDGKVQYSEGLDIGYRWYADKDIAPLFPFGFGLSYTSFAYHDLHVSGLGTAGGTAKVTATVTNTGPREGADVAQLYVGDPASTGEPSRQLKGFQRVDLKPGASTTVSFPLTAHDLAYWNTTSNGWTTAPGAYGISVGDSAQALPLTGSLTVRPDQTGADPVTITAPAPQNAHEGHPLSLDVTAEDTTTAPVLTYRATGLPTGLLIGPRGTITGIPLQSGTFTITATATDRRGAGASTTFVLTVEPPLAGRPTGTITGVVGGLCAEVPTDGATNGAPIDVAVCQGLTGQEWTAEPDRTLHDEGQCLTVAGDATASGAPVQIADCHDSPGQFWVAQPDHTLTNPHSGLCLTDPSGPVTLGSKLQAATCTGATDQQWRAP